MGIQRCMDLGQDLLIPDPDSCMFGISDRAIIDVADSLMAVKKLVFDEKKLTMDELLKALDSNFEGKRGEEIRQMCLAQPKFGNDMDEVDLLAKKDQRRFPSDHPQLRQLPIPQLHDRERGSCLALFRRTRSRRFA